MTTWDWQAVFYISGAVEFDDRPGPVRDALVAMVQTWQRALERAIIEILRRTDEGGKGSVIERVRKSVIRVQVKNLTKPLNHLQRHAVINRSPGIVRVVKETGIPVCQAARRTWSAKIGFTRRPPDGRGRRWRATWGARSHSGHRGSRWCSEGRADV